MPLPTSRDTSVLTGDHGLSGVVHWAGGDPAPATVRVSLDDGRHLRVPAAVLQRRPDGSYYLPLGPAEIAAAGEASDDATVEGSIIPLVAEQIDIQKRQVETGRVRITKTVETEEQTVDVALHREDVTVERVPVERFVTEVPPVRHEGDVMIVPIMEEVLVVEKRLMVREELRLTTRRTETTEPRTVVLRKETAHVERVPAE